ncbi:MAG TPA: sugar ABC transporter permease [Egibacteraceae bacterium]|nr:sugar ABC transporter permease [Egibacteraceae bacterium]
MAAPDTRGRVRVPSAPGLASRRREQPAPSAASGRVSYQGATPWLIPLLVVVTLFYLWPAIQALRFSFTDASLLRDQFDYGLTSYQRVLPSPSFLFVVRITLVFVLASIFFQLSLGLGVALAVQHGVRNRLPGTAIARTLVLSSWVMPGVIIGIIWQIVLSGASYGLANSMLATIGISPVGFLSTTNMALGSVIVANIWRGTAFSMILQYAGLQSIDPVLYEAAAVDGASKWQSFWRVTLPSLRPILMVNLVLISIQTFNTFDMVLALTGGGPGRATEVLALRTFNMIFRNFSLGQGSVLAVVMLALSLSFALLYVRLLRTEERL